MPAWAVETHIGISQEPFCAVIFRKNAGPLFRARHCVRACAVATHMDISQEPLMWKFSGKMLDPHPTTTSIKHKALIWPQDPLSVATLSGEKIRTHQPNEFSFRLRRFSVWQPGFGFILHVSLWMTHLSSFQKDDFGKARLGARDMSKRSKEMLRNFRKIWERNKYRFQWLYLVVSVAVVYARLCPDNWL